MSSLPVTISWKDILVNLGFDQLISIKFDIKFLAYIKYPKFIENENKTIDNSLIHIAKGIDKPLL